MFFVLLTCLMDFLFLFAFRETMTTMRYTQASQLRLHLLLEHNPYDIITTISLARYSYMHINNISLSTYGRVPCFI